MLVSTYFIITLCLIKQRSDQIIFYWLVGIGIKGVGGCELKGDDVMEETSLSFFLNVGQFVACT